MVSLGRGGGGRRPSNSEPALLFDNQRLKVKRCSRSLNQRPHHSHLSHLHPSMHMTTSDTLSHKPFAFHRSTWPTTSVSTFHLLKLHELRRHVTPSRSQPSTVPTRHLYNVCLDRRVGLPRCKIKLNSIQEREFLHKPWGKKISWGKYVPSYKSRKQCKSCKHCTGNELIQTHWNKCRTFPIIRAVINAANVPHSEEREHNPFSCSKHSVWELYNLSRSEDDLKQSTEISKSSCWKSLT